MSQATLLQRINQCRMLRDQSVGQESTRYGYELLGLMVAGGYQEPPLTETWATLDSAYRSAYLRGRSDGQSIMKIEKLKESI